MTEEHPCEVDGCGRAAMSPSASLCGHHAMTYSESNHAGRQASRESLARRKALGFRSNEVL